MIAVARIRKCKGAAADCLRAAGERTHLLYFLAVFVEAHGAYALAAGGCLVLGVASELVPTRPGEEPANRSIIE